MTKPDTKDMTHPDELCIVLAWRKYQEEMKKIHLANKTDEEAATAHVLSCQRAFFSGCAEILRIHNLIAKGDDYEEGSRLLKSVEFEVEGMQEQIEIDLITFVFMRKLGEAITAREADASTKH